MSHRDNWLSIRCHLNLKTPLYSWTLNNTQGGSFSSSGMHRSLKACLAQFRASFPSALYLDCKVYITNIYGYDNDTPITGTIETYLAKILTNKGLK
jgi:hypothetical protein